LSAPSIRPALMLGAPLHHRTLLRQLLERDVAGRYRGSFGGMLWAFASPLFMLLVYTVVFGGVFGMRWGGASTSAEFGLVLFSGLILYNFFAECAGRAPGLVAGQPNYVRKVIFPLDALAWVAVGSALFHAAIAVFAWIVFHALLRGLPPITILWLPLVLAAFVPVALAACWLLAALGVYVRDVSQAVAIGLQALLFLSPVFFDVRALPPAWRPWMLANPLTFVVEQARRVMLAGMAPDFAGLALYAAAACLACWLSFAIFQRLRPGFADVV
jgi:lipopolysaccharide transport system permease protein